MLILIPVRSVVKYFPLPVLVANKNIRKKLEQGSFNSATFDVSSALIKTSQITSVGAFSAKFNINTEK